MIRVFINNLVKLDIYKDKWLVLSVLCITLDGYNLFAGLLQINSFVYFWKVNKFNMTY